MINKRFTVLSADLNVLDPIELVVEIIKEFPSANNSMEYRYLYPNQIQIINDCGANLEWLSLKDENEYLEYSLNPESFTFVRLPKGFTLQDDSTSFGRCHTFIIKATSSSSSDLIVEFINYRYSSLK